MQERLKQFMEWADRWKLKIAEHKCCVLTHGSDILPTYNLNGVQLLNVKEFRDLGIIVDADCLFNPIAPRSAISGHLRSPQIGH